MPYPPHIIIEIGDRYCTATHGASGYKLRAVVKFTYNEPQLPGVKNKTVKWLGPFGLQNDPVTEGSPAGEWNTAEAVRLLRIVADDLEAKDAFHSADEAFQGDLLAVMTYELNKP